jgi:uncharacterized membrane protein YgdD (TMEM256/DUF423 family)
VSHRVWLALGAACGFLAVAFGAFGAHGLKTLLEANGQTANFETGARYLAYHALALLAVGWFAREQPSRATTIAGWGFALGAPIFSGTLMALALTNVKVLGAITPIGGLGLLVGWFALIVAGATLPDRAPKA